jgi:hypothetical protein
LLWSACEHGEQYFFGKISIHERQQGLGNKSFGKNSINHTLEYPRQQGLGNKIRQKLGLSGSFAGVGLVVLLYFRLAARCPARVARCPKRAATQLTQYKRFQK